MTPELIASDIIERLPALIQDNRQNSQDVVSNIIRNGFLEMERQKSEPITTWQIRVMNEKNELDRSLARLSAFIDQNPNIPDQEHLELLKKQAVSMSEYSKILAARLEIGLK